MALETIVCKSCGESFQEAVGGEIVVLHEGTSVYHSMKGAKRGNGYVTVDCPACDQTHEIVFSKH